MANVNPAKAIGIGVYHFAPNWTANYIKDEVSDYEKRSNPKYEKIRYEEFEDVIKSGYFNTVISGGADFLNDEFWRIIFENDCTVWMSCWTSFDSQKGTIEEWIAPKDEILSQVKKHPDRWERFMGFHFDEPIWRGQSNNDFLTQTKALRDLYHKRIFPVFACGEFTNYEGNAMQLNMEASGMRKVNPKALKYVTDIAFDSYSVDVREGWGNGDYVEGKMHGKYPEIVDGKTYYSHLAKVLLDLVDHEVNLWFFPTCYTTDLWRGGCVGEGFCIGHLEYMAEQVKAAKHPGGLFLYTYTQFSRQYERGLKSHLVVKDEEGKLKLEPEHVKWWDYSDVLKKVCAEVKNTESDIIESIED
jgi:hypothetical protein